ncbi:hypothetical protein ACLOJK_016081 [Asimina triloba]
MHPRSTNMEHLWCSITFKRWVAAMAATTAAGEEYGVATGGTHARPPLPSRRCRATADVAPAMHRRRRRRRLACHRPNPPPASVPTGHPSHSSRRRRRAHFRSVEAASRRSSQWPHEANLPRPSSTTSASSRSDPRPGLDDPGRSSCHTADPRSTTQPAQPTCCRTSITPPPVVATPTPVVATPMSICQHAHEPARCHRLARANCQRRCPRTRHRLCPLPASTAFIHAVRAAHQRPRLLGPSRQQSRPPTM